MAALARIKMRGQHMEAVPPSHYESGPLDDNRENRKQTRRTFLPKESSLMEALEFKPVKYTVYPDSLGNGRIVTVWEIPDGVTGDQVILALRKVTILPHIYDVFWSDLVPGAIIKPKPMTGAELRKIAIKICGQEYGAIEAMAAMTDKSRDTIERQMARDEVDPTLASLVRYLERDILGDADQSHS